MIVETKSLEKSLKTGLIKYLLDKLFLTREAFNSLIKLSIGLFKALVLALLAIEYLVIGAPYSSFLSE